MAIIGISGKKTVGKDTVGKIIQILIDSPHFNTNGVASFLKRELLSPSFNIKKFADTLKDMMCMLIGCTREQLENEDFKNTELPEEWWYYDLGGCPKKIVPRGYYPNQSDNDMCDKRYLVKPTPRTLMQLLGTEAGRDILHPNLWVISLMSKYKPNNQVRDIIKDVFDDSDKKLAVTPKLPNWVITDMRFLNEVEAVFQRDGLLLRVESKRCNNEDKHPSETALDNFKGFNEVIVNDGTIEELIEKVREILIKYKFINV